MSRVCVNEGGAGSIIRFEEILQINKAVELPPGVSAALQSWQLRSKESVTVIDSMGGCWRARLQESEPKIMLCPYERIPVSIESPVRLTLFQALPEKERFELILQKTTELGVDRIVPVQTRHSTTLAERDAGQKKSHRWPDVVLKAAKQCRRAMLPELGPTVDFDTALQQAVDSEVRLVLDHVSAPWALSEILFRQVPVSVALLVGPEGGFATGEIEAAHATGIIPVSLGPRVLRTETAAIAALTAIQYAVGDLAAGNR